MFPQEFQRKKQKNLNCSIPVWYQDRNFGNLLCAMQEVLGHKNEDHNSFHNYCSCLTFPADNMGSDDFGFYKMLSLCCFLLKV